MASATGRLRRVLVRRPPADVSAWQALGWTAEPDPAALAAEHEALCLTLEQAGAEVVVAEPRGLDAIYTYDAALVADAGVVLLRPGKEARRDEPEALVPYLDRVLARLDEPAFAEGGDLFWLAPGVLCAGLRIPDEHGRRRGARAAARLRGALVRPPPRPRARRSACTCSR